MKTALVCGAGGFIGGHLVKRLKSEGYWVRGVDIKRPDFGESAADDFVLADLRDDATWLKILDRAFDEVYQLAADMGGAGYIFSGNHDVEVMHNSASINLNALNYGYKAGINKIFYSSSACIYPAYNQLDPNNPKCNESSAYPAEPDSEYGWEKLYAERLYTSFKRNYNISIRIARFHNIFGWGGTWRGGKEKAPAAMIRKVIETPDGGEIEVWGKGDQSRSFLYIDECVEAVMRLMESECKEIVNIGSEEMVTINELAKMCIDISGKNLSIKNIDGEEYVAKYGTKCPRGVNGRNSDNKLYKEQIGWTVSEALIDGLRKTYPWIKEQFEKYELLQKKKF